MRLHRPGYVVFQGGLANGLGIQGRQLVRSGGALALFSRSSTRGLQAREQCAQVSGYRVCGIEAREQALDLLAQRVVVRGSADIAA